MYIKLILYLYLSGLNCANENFNVDTSQSKWVPRPGGDCGTASLFGFSITIDESKSSLFVGAPGCNRVYECPNFGNCRDVNSKMSYSPMNQGNTYCFRKTSIACTLMQTIYFHTLCAVISNYRPQGMVWGIITCQ